MKRILTLLALLTMAPQTWAWGEHTHRVICDITWRNLTSEAKNEVRLLLEEAKQKTFANACVWPDAIRSMSRYDFAKPHHYINVTKDATQVTETETCRTEGCVTSAIAAYSTILSGEPVEGYHNNRAKALMFLGHFVGDIHQPLHVAYEEDRGGTMTMLSYAAKDYSLHYVWDVIIPESGLSKNWRKAGELLDKQTNEAERAAWIQSDTLDWANESLVITRQIYADLPDNGIVNRDYFNYYYLASEQRIRQAGIRLANLLNTIFK